MHNSSILHDYPITRLLFIHIYYTYKYSTIITFNLYHHYYNQVSNLQLKRIP